MKKIKKQFGKSMCFIAFVIIVVLLAYFVRWFFFPLSVASFDEAQWKISNNGLETGECNRGRMAGDLTRSVLKPGMSRKLVTDMLGVPDSISGHEYKYILGMCTGIATDYDILHIYFDEDWKILYSENRQS